MKYFLSLLTLFAVSIALGVQGRAGPYNVDVRTDPSVVPIGRAKLTITLTDASGKAVSAATVKVLTQMPGMPMGEREESASPMAQPGAYSARAVFGMAGGYDAKVSISGPLGSATVSLPLQTGQSTAEAGGGVAAGSVIVWVLVAAAALFVIWMIRRSRQQVTWRGIFNRQVLLSVVLLGAALAVAIWFVNTQRRPGAMTPLEAQVMEMNAPPPEGVLPVRLATVSAKSMAETVTYTGQAVGFTEQDVVPRVPGSIIWMPYYVGTRVTKGQLIARLDTTQIDPMVSEKIAGVNSAQQGVGVAAMEYQQAVNAVTQARAEVSMAEGEVAEARAMLDAAQQGRGTAASLVESAQADVQAMKAEMSAAQADLDYQRQDLDRMRSLNEKGAISKDEWQRAQSDTRKSQAQLDKARENVNRAQAGVSGASAELRKADAEISAARRKVQQVQAQVRAKQASVQTALSAAAAAKNKIGQSQAEVAGASAGLRGATTQRGYAELRSEVDGVVTQRVVSPGVVVAPGQVILKVAQVSPIRLQANVPEADLARIQHGATVKIARRDMSAAPVLAQVTSIAPSVDPNSRTGVVEAVYANTDRRFLPGQYVSMEITIGGSSSSLAVPGSALQTSEGHSFVWVAQPAANGEFLVARQEIQVGVRTGDLVAVRSGLNSGDQIVLSPPLGLAAGDRVSSLETATPAAADQTIEITAAGYSPPSINVPANKPFRVTFIRRDDKTCGTEVIFPDLGIRKALPLNQPVVIEIPAQPAGKELNFTCPMNMLKGKAVAR